MIVVSDESCLEGAKVEPLGYWEWWLSSSGQKVSSPSLLSGIGN